MWGILLATIGEANSRARAAGWSRRLSQWSLLYWKRQSVCKREVKAFTITVELFTAPTFGVVCRELGCNLLTVYRERSVRRAVRTSSAPRQVTWPRARDLFARCRRTNSQISFYRAKGLYYRQIGGAATEMFSRLRRTQILSDSFMYRKHYTLKTLALDFRYGNT